MCLSYDFTLHFICVTRRERRSQQWCRRDWWKIYFRVCVYARSGVNLSTGNECADNTVIQYTMFITIPWPHKILASDWWTCVDYFRLLEFSKVDSYTSYKTLPWPQGLCLCIVISGVRLFMSTSNKHLVVLPLLLKKQRNKHTFSL